MKREVFNTGKEIEAMKHLMLHRIATSLHRFITSVAQLCLQLQNDFLSFLQHFYFNIFPIAIRP
jgi:hypothetical protein